MERALLQVRSLTKEYKINQSMLKTSTVHAVRDVSFSIKAGETYGLVGESGSGKTTISRCLVNLEQYQSGEILFQGEDIKDLHKQSFKFWKKEKKAQRFNRVKRDIQMVFQDHSSSFDPKQTIESMFIEVLKIHKWYRSKNAPLSEYDRKSRSGQKQLIIDSLEKVGLKKEDLGKYPYQFSGGQLQRIAIARALVLEPQLLICDEPVSALDVSIQAQILNLLKQLKYDNKLSMLFISHDISVIHYLADRIGVLYRGVLVEEGTREELFGNPKHPYTQLLLGKGVLINERHEYHNLSKECSCAYYPVCPKGVDQCKGKALVRSHISGSHSVMCHCI